MQYAIFLNLKCTICIEAVIKMLIQLSNDVLLDYIKLYDVLIILSTHCLPQNQKFIGKTCVK